MATKGQSNMQDLMNKLDTADSQIQLNNQH